MSHGFRDRGRVVFFAPTVALVKQQHEEFKRWFSALKVDYLVGPEIEEKAEINVMLRDNQVNVSSKGSFCSCGSTISLGVGAANLAFDYFSKLQENDEILSWGSLAPVDTTIFNGLEALLLTHSNLQLRSCHQVTLHDIYDRWRTITSLLLA